MNNPYELTLWQKKQAALLYHFSSLDYLKGLQQRVNDLITLNNVTLDLAKAQGRDSLLADKRWGGRDTSENWANNAWPFLKDFQLSIAGDISNRAFEIYDVTGAYQCGRGMDEYSMRWATPEEEENFTKQFRQIYRYANNIDDTMNKHGSSSRWDDFAFAHAWQEFKGQFSRIPRFRVRTDIEGETGRVPARTGVYVPLDDPDGALQFAWIGGGLGGLLETRIFNALGHDALYTVGRKDLWLNESKMFAFATSPKYANLFKKEVFFRSQPAHDLAPSAVAREAFTTRSCKWYYVELVNGEFEDIEESPAPEPDHERLRIEGGKACPKTGYWFTPAEMNSRRHFKGGEVMPVLGSDYGSVIWQWDSNQVA
jgi:hypothetical protein